MTEKGDQSIKENIFMQKLTIVSKNKSLLKLKRAQAQHF